MFRECVRIISEQEKKKKKLISSYEATHKDNAIKVMWHIHQRKWLAKIPNNLFTVKSSAAFLSVSFFLALIPCQAAMNGSIPMNLVHPVCKIHAESRRMHLLENSFAKADQAGWKPHCTFPLFFPLQNSYRKSNISWKHLCWNRVIPCTSKITSLTQTPMMGTRR